MKIILIQVRSIFDLLRDQLAEEIDYEKDYEEVDVTFKAKE